MSVIERACGEAASGGLICEHIAAFYQGIGGEPPVFYILDAGELPSGYEIIETLSDTGDMCHREVISVSNSRLKKAFKDRAVGDFLICDGNGPRSLTSDDIRAFKSSYGG